ncbi:MAG: hypothetical protein Q9217_004855 [Psora testacea]
MAFVYSSQRPSSEIKVDIIFVPAIAADPKLTWARQPESEAHERLDNVLFDKLATAQVHLYDHLTEWERSLTIPKTEARPLTELERASVNAFAEAEKDVAVYGVEEWADRLLARVREYRRGRGIDDRPIIFISHSTGGTVVKCALVKKNGNEPNEIATNTIGVTFFAVPHQGSSVLSEPEYVQTVQDHLGLKWQMSMHLRRDFQLRDTNPDLEELNHKFAVGMVGVKIHSYAETSDTYLTVLTSETSGGEWTATIRLCIVDSRSAKLGTAHAPVEDEEFMQLDVNHTELPRFTEQDIQYDFYLTEIEEMVKGYSAEDRAAYQQLNKAILTDTKIHVHQFYGDTKSMKILLTKLPLEAFLELGPAKAMNERIKGRGFNKEIESIKVMERPKIELRPVSEPEAPILKVTAVDSDVSSDNQSHSSDATLPVPTIPVPKNIHTQRPPVSIITTAGNQSNTLLPNMANSPRIKAVQLNDGVAQRKDRDEFKAPQRAVPFKLPDRASDRFKWIHVPFTHPGWVHHVLGTISGEKKNHKLHTKLLTDKIWISQHNQSRYASPHSRFVRPCVKWLRPEGESKHTDGITTPSSASDGIQFVVYLPYLHWDSFTNMKKRADIIERRRHHVQARPTPPIPRDIALCPSIEHKLIWQYLTLDRPLHCRRTLDQYGYPSLRHTTVRDHDQILWKRTKLDAENIPSSQSKVPLRSVQTSSKGTRGQCLPTGCSRDHVAKVLMVDQLWLWVVDYETVVTFFPGRENDNHDGYSRVSDVRSLIYRDINGDYANQCSDPFDFAALAVLHAVKALLDHDRDRDRTLQVFRIFEEYISILTEQQNRSFKDFRDNHRFEKAKDIETEKHVDNREDLNALLELRDIEDELNTIGKLIKEQQGCVADMMTQFHDLNARHAKGLKGIDFLHDINHFLDEHKEQVEGMLKSARAAKQAYNELLDMKQKQANVIEAHLARVQTNVAANQSRTVMIFTIFTIIFLPLSFFASVFGINTKEWNGPDSNYLSLRNIFTYMLTISLAVIVIALLAAFSRPARNLAMKSWRLVALPFVRLYEGKHPVKAKIRGNAVPGLADPENTAVDAQIKRENKRLSTISRQQSKIDRETGWMMKMMFKQPKGSAE